MTVTERSGKIGKKHQKDDQKRTIILDSEGQED